jgi:broad specificity phosphatase PhoE
MPLQLVYLMRHGQTDWNRSQRVMGWEEVPLNARGRAQAEASGRWLAAAGLRRIVTSPLARAAQTAAIVSRQLASPTAVIHDDRLREFNMGRWSGMTREELRQDAAYRAYREDPLHVPFPSGETLGEVGARAAACWRETLAAGADGVLFVSHAGVIKLLLARFLAIDLAQFWRLEVANAAVSIIDVSRTEPRVVAVNVLPDGNYEEAEW